MGNRQLGPWLIEPELNQISSGSAAVSLSPKAMDVLVYLNDRRGAVISRAELLENVWEGRIVTDGAVNRIIGELRRALITDQVLHDPITTVPKRGYQLTEPAKRNEAVPWRRLSLAAAAAIVGLILVVLWRNDPLLVPRQIPFRLDNLTTLAGNEDWPDISADGRLVAFSHRPPDSDRWHIKLIQRDQPASVVSLTSGEVQDLAPAFSPDGSVLAYHRRYPDGGCEIRAVGIDGRRDRMVVGCRAGAVSIRIAWSIDGSRLYFSDGDRRQEPLRVYSISLDTGHVQALTNPSIEGFGDYRLAVHHSSPGLFAVLRNRGDRGSEVVLMDPDQGESLLHRFDGLATDLRFSGNGSALVIAHDINRLSRLPLDGSKPQLLLEHSDRLTSIALTPSGDHVVAAAGGYSTLQLVRRSEHAWVNLDVGTGNARNPDVSSAGTLAFVSDQTGTNQVWLMEGHGDPYPVTDFENCRSLPGVRWERGGNRLVGLRDGRVFVIDVHAGSYEDVALSVGEVINVNWSAQPDHLLVAAMTDHGPQIFETPLGPGATKLTTAGGSFAEMTPDRRYLVLLRPQGGQLARIDLGSGEATDLLVDRSLLAENIRLHDDRILVSLPAGDEAMEILSIDVASGAVESLFTADLVGVGGFAIAAEGPDAGFLMTTPRQSETRLLAVELGGR